MSTTTPPGWHPDPQVPGQNRYWDGNQWTDQTAPATPGGPVPPVHQPGGVLVAEPKKKNWFMRHKIMSGLLALLVIIGLSSALGGGGDDETATDSPQRRPIQTTPPSPSPSPSRLRRPSPT